MKIEESYFRVMNREQFQNEMNNNAAFVDRVIIQMNSLEDVENSGYAEYIPHPEKINFNENVAIIEKRNFRNTKKSDEMLSCIIHKWEKNTTGYLLYRSMQLIPVVKAMIESGLTVDEIIEKLSK